MLYLSPKHIPLVYLANLFTMGICYIVFNIIDGNTTRNDTPAYYIVATIITIALPLIAWRLSGYMPIHWKPAGSKKRWISVIGGALLAIGAIRTSYYFISWSEVLPLDPGYGSSTIVGTIVFGWVLAPIAEEIACRGIIQESLHHLRWKPWLSILVSALFFAFLHLDVVHLATTFFLGLALAYVYYLTRSTLICIVVHVINNIYNDDWIYELTGIKDGEFGMVVMYMLVLLFGFIAIRKNIGIINETHQKFN